MGNNLCSCEYFQDNTKTISLSYNKNNNERLKISFVKNNLEKESNLKSTNKKVNTNNNHLNLNSFTSVETLDKNENKNISINNTDLNNLSESIIQNFTNSNLENENNHSNRNSSFSIMKVNAVPSVEYREAQDLNTMNKNEMFNKLINGK